jgi:hypothetical protein
MTTKNGTTKKKLDPFTRISSKKAQEETIRENYSSSAFTVFLSFVGFMAG